MIKSDIRRQKITTGLFLFVLLLPGLIFSQPQKGRVLSTETNSGIGFVNIGIIGKNVGTVSDEKGNFSITLEKIYDNDSLRFSMIGYESETFLVRYFRESSIKTVYLKPVSYELGEVKVIYRRTKEIIIGAPVTSGNLISGFAYNDLGSEMGIKAHIKRKVKLKDINLNIANCTFDSVTYRLNIYQSVNQADYKNILTQPVYISFSKDKIKRVITFDLRNYSIIIDGDVLITLEMHKYPGEGSLLFFTDPKTSFTNHKKTSEGKWTRTPGAIGMYLHGQVVK